MLHTLTTVLDCMFHMKCQSAGCHYTLNIH